MTRKVRSYTETERVAIMTLALTEGPKAAMQRYDVPERTLYHFFDEAGGLAHVRSFVNEAREQAVARASTAICQEVVNRSAKLADDELMITFRKMIETASAQAPPATPVQVNFGQHQEYHISPEAMAAAVATYYDAQPAPSKNGAEDGSS